MTVMVLRYLIFLLRFYCSVFSLVLISTEKIYQILKTVFVHITKHLKVRQKYPATRHIFDSLCVDWKFGQTRYFVFGILLTGLFSYWIKSREDFLSGTYH